MAKYVPGVSGTAIKFDGFSSFIEGVPELFTKDEEIIDDLSNEISVEAWVALGAYPWNWAPIISLGRFGITGFYFGINSRGCVGFHISDGTNIWHECNSPINEKTKVGLELKKWYHVVGTYSKKKGMTVYVNGQLQATYNNFTFDYGLVFSELEKGFRMGMNREKLAPTDPVRTWATFPSRYTLDGIVDEIKIYKKALSAEEVKKLYQGVAPENEPEFAPRKFPTVKSSHRFGANYTTLKYYPEWDTLWPVGDQLDVVVQFDELPIKVMFWRGTRYSPCWVSENGKWMADQSRETGNNWFLSQGSSDLLPTGCIEHMSDTQCRSSRVAIIENNDARVVVNWRYLQMDVRFRQRDLPDHSGFGEWGNELYFIYPDGVGVRKVLPGRGGWQETIALNEPGTRPEDNLKLKAITLFNMNGQKKTYSWEDGYPQFDLPDANIQLVNLKSKFKPFLILRKGGGFEVFNLEVRPEYSHFPWWNHWPIAQIHSDGRYAFAPDRASHSSLSWGIPNGDAALYGMTDRPDKILVPLARSWNNPPALQLRTQNILNQGYDYTERAYKLKAANRNIQQINFTLQGSDNSPVFNPAFVIYNLTTDGLTLFVNDVPVTSKKKVRFGLEYDVEATPRVIVWSQIFSTKPVEFKIVRKSN
ncbi:MAG: LamG domain-containing protein [Caldisericaceae bacterium]|nr:LamG domain-containing protein [Caldisericaceae bacterium]